MITSVDVATLRLVTVTVFDVAPLATLTLEGTVATFVFEEKSDTTAPPEGAGPFNETVAVEVAPLTTLPGEKLTRKATGMAVMPRLTGAFAPP
jgi:hypothetical protein